MSEQLTPKNAQQERKSQSNIYTIKETENRWKKVFGNLYGYNTSRIPNAVSIGSAFGNNPFIANERIKRLSTQPNLYSREDIEKALLDPGNSELTLRGAAHSIINQTYPLYKLQYLYEGILSYKHYVQPMYVSREDMDKPRFKSDEKFVDMWVKKLDPQKTFRRIVAQLLVEGKRAYILRQQYNTTTDKEDVDYVMLQDVPSDWFRITSITSDSYYGISFDFFYFTMPGTSLAQFPEYFTKIFEELMGYGTSTANGSIIIDPDKIKNSERITCEYNSELSTWAYWAEIPADIAWTFCFTEADPFAISPFVSLLLLGSDLANYSLLQQQLVSAPLSSLILGEMMVEPETKHTGFTTDNFAISPEALALFENSINSVLANANIAYKMTPSTKNQMFNVPSVPNAQNIYNEAVRGLINTAGTSALQTLSEKPSVAQTNNARITEFRFVDRIYSQFEHFVNTIFEEMYDIGDLKFRWKFRIFGNSFFERDDIKDLEKSLTMGQVELMPKYLAMHDLSMLDASTLCDYVDSTGLYTKLMPLVSSYTMNSENINDHKQERLKESKKITDVDDLDEGGRPEVENPENDNTDASKNLGESDARNE